MTEPMLVYDLEPVDLLEGLPAEFEANGVPRVAVSDDGLVVLYDYPGGSWSGFERCRTNAMWRRLEKRPAGFEPPLEEVKPETEIPPRVLLECPCGSRRIVLASAQRVCTDCGSHGDDLKATPQ